MLIQFISKAGGEGRGRPAEDGLKEPQLRAAEICKPSVRKPRRGPAHSPPRPFGFKTVLKPENERREKVSRGRGGGGAGKHDQNKFAYMYGIFKE